MRNLTALRSLVAVLRDGGKRILSTANRHFIEQLPPSSSLLENGELLVQRTDSYDAAAKCLQRFAALIPGNHKVGW
jgi:hypothetical protein